MEVGTISHEACAGVVGLGKYFRDMAKFRRENGNPPDRRTTDTSSPQSQTAGDMDEVRCHHMLKEVGGSSFQPLERRDVLETYRQFAVAESSLLRMLCKRLRQSPHVRLLQEQELDVVSTQKLPVVSFVHSKIPPSAIASACADFGVACRNSTFLSTQRFKNAFDLTEEGVVRFSMAHYNKEAELNYTMDKLETLPKWF